jgi:hypothetical protein
MRARLAGSGATASITDHRTFDRSEAVSTGQLPCAKSQDACFRDGAGVTV